MYCVIGFSGLLGPNCISLNNQPCMNRTTLNNLNLDEYKDCVTTHLWLVYIDSMEVVMLLIICQVEYVFRIKQKT